jgi:hypothetical protein
MPIVLSLSIQGISQTQLQTLKTRMEATKQKLEQAQAAPESQRATILQGLTGDHLTGDLLTATVWGYFAALQSHGAIASAQAQMVDRPALSYGLFHAQVRPNKLYGIVTTGITFQGLSMDIGHLRHTRWVKNDDPSAAINNKPELTTTEKLQPKTAGLRTTRAGAVQQRHGARGARTVLGGQEPMPVHRRCANGAPPALSLRRFRLGR